MDDQAQSIRDRFRKYSPELGLLLWAVWNPIGADVPLSEYESYVPTVWRMLEEDASIEVVAAELARICTETIGVEAGTNDAAADTVKRWWYWRFVDPEELAAESR